MKFRLCVMMFLQFFIWGAWYPLVFAYVPSLGFNSDWQVPLVLGAFNLSALVAMFFSNQFVDRNFAAEKFLAFSHLVGGGAMIGLSFIKKPADGPADFWLFFALMLVHCLFYVPTISITNAIAFANLKDPTNEFGIVRLFGTIGWIMAAVPFAFILVDYTKVPSVNEVGAIEWVGKALGAGLQGEDFLRGTANTFMAAGIASLGLAAFRPLLPPPPPTSSAVRPAQLH